MSKVVVHAAYVLNDKAKGGFDEKFGDFLEQVGRDLLVGTFADFHKSIFPNAANADAFQKRAAEAAACHDDRNDADVARNIFGFRVEFDTSLFADPDYALQRLIHTLASDVFLRRISDHAGFVAVKTIDFGALKGTIEAAYRTQSNDRAKIRQAFALGDHKPLLAFSLKPRSCLSDDDYYAITRQAFDSGCDIVELDTRDLLLHGADRLALFETLTSLALDMSKGRICRFSANLSGPPRVIGPIYERLAQLHEAQAPEGPWVIKVDGNLDGLSLVQAIRAGQFTAYAQPIITCYPVLKYALERALGPDGFVRMLAMSGVDVIYPGQSPSFGNANGRIDTQRVAAAKQHYQTMDMGGYPLLSVAGGVAINSVHACLSVLGPDIAFFVGGGIATSKQGIKSGASNFARAIEYACLDLFEGQKVNGLEAKFVDLSKVYFDNRKVPEEYEFIRPTTLKAVAGRYKSTSLES
ncbi:hypothetical protein [Novosphingobium sp. M1R2S20]|uniref:Uncharacterized protein n=1 Tax=Novosphingobium rhizovicinum TaxID=3228928 RepID=A0ABV3RAQ3_9SPHN